MIVWTKIGSQSIANLVNVNRYVEWTVNIGN